MAFPLDPKSDDCKNDLQIYSVSSEPVWLANRVGCPGDNRCPYSFSNSSAFKKGTFGVYRRDVCDLGPFGLDLMPDSDDKKGLCALAVAKTPRTQLKGSFDYCHKVDSDDVGYPFKGYSWNVTGDLGHSSTQPCPEGQSGKATWECGMNGRWIDFPDLSECTKIDVEARLSSLTENDENPPAKVLKDLFADDLQRERNLASGDIKSVVKVVDEAVKAQNRRTGDDDAGDVEDFTQSSVTVIDDILSRTTSWAGIREAERAELLTDIQVNVDSIADNLIKVSSSSSQNLGLRKEFAASNKALVVNILPEANLTFGEVFTDGFSSISVSSDGGSDNNLKGLSFISFPSFGCIMAQQAQW